MEWQPLDFEKPIFELERRLQDLKNHSDQHDVDLDSAIKELETKLRETRRQIYGKYLRHNWGVITAVWTVAMAFLHPVVHRVVA